MRLPALLVALAASISVMACGDATNSTAPEYRTTPPGNGDRGIAVMSRNLYLGADLDPLAAAIAGGASLPELLVLAGQAWNGILATDFTARAGALATEVAEYRPHLIGLQEVSTYTLVPLDPNTLMPVGGPQVVFDFLATLQGELDALGQDYHVASAQAASTLQLAGIILNPAAGYAPGLYLIIWQDADVILARGDVATSGAAGGTFAVTLPIAPGIEIVRGWTAITATVKGRTFRAFNTHLETQGPAGGLVNAAHGQELLAIAGQVAGPVVLMGDFNSAANPGAPAGSTTPTYPAVIASGYTDLHVAAAGSTGGLTCCHAADLTGPAAFTQRIDFIFARGFDSDGWTHTARFDVLGESAGDQFDYLHPVFGPLTIWPSDHAGVVASFVAPAGGLAAAD